MRSQRVLLAAITLPLVLGTGWAGEERLTLLGETAEITAVPVTLDLNDAQRRRLGGLTFLGGVALESPDPAFGGFSALSVERDGFTLLSDGGNVARFRLTSDWRVVAPTFANLPGGPRTGWTKRDRDAESMTVDPRTRQVWVGFEAFPQIWRFSPNLVRAERGATPRAMRRWRLNGGAESLARLADRRFVVIAESPLRRAPEWGRVGLVWAGDPTRISRPAFRFTYRPTRGYDPVDMTQLPDGRIAILERAFGLPFNWSSRLVLVNQDALRPGAVVEGRFVARFAAPLIHDNFEGVAATMENGATILWLISDDNQLFLQRTLLLKFRLDA